MFKYVLAFLTLSAPLNAATIEPDSTIFVFDYTSAEFSSSAGTVGQRPLIGQSLTLRFGIQFLGLYSSAPDGTYFADYDTGTLSGFIDAWIITPGWSRGALTWTVLNGLPVIEGMLMSQSFANSLSIGQTGDDWQSDQDTRYFSSAPGEMSLISIAFSCQFICGAPPPIFQDDPPTPPTNVPLPAAGWLLVVALITLARFSGARFRGRSQSHFRCSV